MADAQKGDREQRVPEVTEGLLSIVFVVSKEFISHSYKACCRSEDPGHCNLSDPTAPSLWARPGLRQEERALEALHQQTDALAQDWGLPHGHSHGHCLQRSQDPSPCSDKEHSPALHCSPDRSSMKV